MTSLRQPTAQVNIQRLPEFVDEPGKNAIVLTTEGPSGGRDATAFDAEIEAAAGEEGGLATLQVSIPNLSLEAQNQIDPDGRIEVVAGYEDARVDESTNDAVPPTLMFVGNIDQAPSHIEGPDTVTRIQATADTSLLTDTSVKLNAKNSSLASIARALMSQVGGSIVVPASAEQFVVEEYTTKDDVLTELRRIASTLHYKTGRPHILTPTVPREGQSSGIGTGTQTPGLTGESASATSYAIVDLDQQKRDAGTERIEYDWSEDTVYKAGPEPSKAQPTVPVPLTGEDGNEKARALKQAQATEEYEFAVPLDPRAFLGLRVDVVNDPRTGNTGTIPALTSVQHSLSSWKTVARGSWQREDIT